GARDYYGAFDENRNKDEIVNILAARSGYTTEQVANEMVPQGVDPNGRLNTHAIGADLEWLQKEGLFAQPIPLDKVIDESHLNAALAVLGPYQAQNAVISSG
ncbi:MAG: extracellular solute-binding protein family 3, partial [Chloroflexi bacterium]|nr:extracellular solute-binding protein family 3 [Chloroflexota bacterium]